MFNNALSIHKYTWSIIYGLCQHREFLFSIYLYIQRFSLDWMFNLPISLSVLNTCTLTDSMIQYQQIQWHKQNYKSFSSSQKFLRHFIYTSFTICGKHLLKYLNVLLMTNLARSHSWICQFKHVKLSILSWLGLV